MAILEVKVIPVGTEAPSLSSYIRECYQVAEQNDDVDLVVTPTSTILEGPLNRVIEIAQAMHQEPFSHHIERVMTTITIDERRDKPEDMDDMVSAVFAEEDDQDT